MCNVGVCLSFRPINKISLYFTERKIKEYFSVRFYTCLGDKVKQGFDYLFKYPKAFRLCTSVLTLITFGTSLRKNSN